MKPDIYYIAKKMKESIIATLIAFVIAAIIVAMIFLLSGFKNQQPISKEYIQTVKMKSDAERHFGHQVLVFEHDN